VYTGRDKKKEDHHQHHVINKRKKKKIKKRKRTEANYPSLEKPDYSREKEKRGEGGNQPVMKESSKNPKKKGGKKKA